MKAAPRSSYAVSIRPEELEYQHLGPEVACHFRGIFEVQLNHTVTVIFIPEFTRDEGTWPPALVEGYNADDIRSAAQARWQTAAFASYVVTPDEARAGEIERVPAVSSDSAGDVVVAYVSREELAGYQEDMIELLQRRPEVHWVAFGGGGVPVDELASYGFVSFLRRVVLRPGVADPRDLAMLMITGSPRDLPH